MKIPDVAASSLVDVETKHITNFNVALFPWGKLIRDMVESDNPKVFHQIDRS
jgi:hypothetical protein